MISNERLFGMETEYALCVGSGPREDALGTLLRALARKFPHLGRSGSNGLFLANGAHFYIDHGYHPEWCTPECRDPWELVRYVLAGDGVLTELLTEAASQTPAFRDAALLKCNVDYSSLTTWGRHESYLCRRPGAEIAQDLVPHLVSRVLFTGAGGLNPFFPGIQFSLSPRAHHFRAVLSGNSTDHRGIFHTKDESLARPGFHRIHVICGESLCSETAMWLKVGTTALVVAMIEAGLRPGDTVRLASPVAALHHFILDPTGSASQENACGKAIRALAIQWRYLQMAEERLKESWMPRWAPEVCRLWRSALERLGLVSGGAHAWLDWQMKKALFQRRMAETGFDDQTTELCNTVAQRLFKGLSQGDGERPILTGETVRQPEPEMAAQLRVMDHLLSDQGMTWEDFARFLDLRDELCEIDMRFGMLGKEGIFHAMDRQGALDHHVPGVDRIEQAMTTPPPGGRAAVRGEWIARLASQDARYECGWTYIRDSAEPRILDFSAPFCDAVEWQPYSQDHGGSELLADSGLLPRLRRLHRETA